MITRFSTALEPDLLAAFDQFIKRHGYQNRSEAVRDLIGKNLIDEQWRSMQGSVVGVISLTYAHQQHKLQDHLTDLQHKDHDLILSTTHIHLDHDNCLEAVMVRGPASRIKTLADRLIALRGVKHGGLTITAADQASK